MLLKLSMLIQCSLMSLADVNEPIGLIEIDNVVTVDNSNTNQRNNKSKKSKRGKRTLSALPHIDSNNKEENNSFPQTTSAPTALICSARRLTTRANQPPIIKKNPQKEKDKDSSKD